MAPGWLEDINHPPQKEVPVMRIVAWCIIAILALTIVSVAVFAQEVYRPVAMTKSGEDTGLFCVTSEEIATGAKLLGLQWIAEPNAMTLMSGKDKVEVSFAQDGCAASAKLVR